MKYQGHSDVALNEEGLRQARLVGERLAGEKLSAVYSSDLSRAMATAKAIAGHHRLPVTPIPELREIKFGDWEGLTYTGINEKWPDEMARLFTHAAELQIPGGESFSQVKERAVRTIARLAEEHQGENIAIVSHGGTIRTIICAALNIHLNYLWNIQQDNTAVNIIEYRNGRVMVSLVNDIHHLHR